MKSIAGAAWMACIVWAGCTTVGRVLPVVEDPDGSVAEAGVIVDADASAARPPKARGGDSGASSAADGGESSNPSTPPKPNKAAGSGGSGGSGGTAGKPSGSMSNSDAGTSEPEPMREKCGTDGAMRCTPGKVGKRERCESGAWVSSEACASGEICRVTGSAADCVAVSEACRGSAGRTVCDDSGVLYKCDADGVATSDEACENPRLCELGLASGKCAACAPGEYRCEGARLERCDSEGRSFEFVEECPSAGLCRPLLGKCTDAVCMAGQFACESNMLKQCNEELTALVGVEPCGAGMCDAKGGQCDMCLPGSKTCEADVVVTCDGEGQGYTRNPCPSSTPQCTGRGQCVQCTSTMECPAPAMCKVRECNVARGSCEVKNAEDGTECDTGVCKAGSCVQCLTNAQCTGNAGACKTNRCNTSTNRCETPKVSDGTTCNGSKVCNDGECVACVTPDDCDGNPGVCKKFTCSSAGSCGVANADEGSECNDGTCRGGTCVPNATCGDKVVNGSEACDPTASGYNVFSCSPDCRSTRRLYSPCVTSDELIQGSCNDGELCTGFAGERSLCLKTATSVTQCPDLGTEYNQGIAGPIGNQCVIRCSGPSDCPSQAPNCIDATIQGQIQYCIP